MIRYFIEGNVIFMGILTVLFLIILSISVVSGTQTFKHPPINIDKITNLLKYIKAIALFTLVFSIFCQILGLVQIFSYISESTIEVASSILAGGIKLTFNTTIYGIIIFLISILISLGFEYRLNTVR